MRRFRIPFILATLAALIVGPAANTAGAQNPPARLEAFVTGQTLGGDPGVPTTPGVRVTGSGEFTDVLIPLVFDCGDEYFVGAAAQSPGHNVGFTTDDDLTDGFGEIIPTDDARAFRAVGVETRTAGDPSDALLEVRIEGGRYDRIVNVVRVTLRLDVRLVRVPGGDVCHVEDVPFRIEFVLAPNPPDDTNPTDDGFTLIGVGRDHYGEDPPPISDRFPCGEIHPYLPPDAGNTCRSTPS